MPLAPFAVSQVGFDDLHMSAASAVVAVVASTA